MTQGALAEDRRREPVPPAEGAREVRSLPIPDQPRDVANRDRGLLGEQLRGDGHATHEQVLAERGAEPCVGTLELAGRRGDGARDGGKRERTAVVTGDNDAAHQIQTAMLGGRIRAHTSRSDC
jgi:hypothetical protein